MTTITPLIRAVLDALDTCERGAGDTEIGKAVWNRCGYFYSHDELLEALLQMIDLGLIEARFADWPLDAGVSADPIIYEITEAGCDVRWALLKAERAPLYARPVSFNSREAFVNFCQQRARA